VMPVVDQWPGDADRRAFIEHRKHQLHETMLDHAIWSRLLEQRVADGAYEAVWIDHSGQPHVTIIDHAFLETHRKFLHTLRGDLIAAGADAPVSLGGIFAPPRHVWPVDLPLPDRHRGSGDVLTLLTHAMATVARAQLVMAHAAQTTEHAQRVRARATTLVMHRRDDPGLGSSLDMG
jgi:hypothetical protein